MLAGPRAGRVLQSEQSQKFPRHRRLRQRQEFVAAFKARRLTSSWVVVYARKKPGGLSRLGIAISKKAIPSAASRNFAKRLVREEFRIRFPVAMPVDVVVQVRHPINPGSAIEGRQTLRRLLQTIYE